MSFEDCEKFYLEKQGQAAKVYADRYAAIFDQGGACWAVWAAEQQPALYRKMKDAQREAGALWVNGVFDEEFKRQVLDHLRAFLEICRAYSDEFERGKASA